MKELLLLSRTVCPPSLPQIPVRTQLVFSCSICHPCLSLGSWSVPTELCLALTHMLPLVPTFLQPCDHNRGHYTFLAYQPMVSKRTECPRTWPSPLLHLGPSQAWTGPGRWGQKFRGKRMGKKMVGPAGAPSFGGTHSSFPPGSSV